MSSKATTVEQKEIPEIIKDETRAPAQTKKYERGRFLGKVMWGINHNLTYLLHKMSMHIARYGVF